MSQPVLETPRLRLTPCRLAETEACLAMDREPGVTRFVSGPWDDPAAHRAFVGARTRGPWPRGLGYWSLRPRCGGDFLGWVLLIPEDGAGPEVEIGWRLRPAAWGHGHATEAAAALLRHGFGTVGLARVVAGIDPANAASLAVAARLGMRPVPAAGRYSRRVLERADYLAAEGSPSP